MGTHRIIKRMTTDVFAADSNDLIHVEEADRANFCDWFFYWAVICQAVKDERSVEHCKEFLKIQNINPDMTSTLSMVNDHKMLIHWLGICENAERIKRGLEVRPITFEGQMRRWTSG